MRLRGNGRALRRADLARRRLVVSVLACAGLGLSVAASQALARDFEAPASNDTSQQFGPGNVQRHDTPNDPNYDYAEPDDEDTNVDPSSNIYDEDFGFFGFPSARTPSATYAVGPNATACQPALPICPQISGYNASGAWKLERGRPDSIVAILDTGIKWDRSGLRTQVHLSQGELPVPNHGLSSPVSDASSLPVGGCSSMANAYDANGDTFFNILDYVCDTRVSITAGPHGDNGKLDPEDLIADPDFSDGADTDSNGFVDDIAGWDFFDNDNDPYDASSYFAASNHGSGRAGEAAERGNDASGSLGVCPHCQLMPIRAWDTFVTDGNNFGMGIIYGTDNGAKVIEGANGSTYHSAFAEQASNYAYENGVAQTFSGDDLNTGNHNYAANYGHAQLIEGTVPDTVGLGMDSDPAFTGFYNQFCNQIPLPTGCAGTSLPVGTYFRGANTTQFGGKSSISMEGPTGSVNTGQASGAAALVISAAKDVGITLRPDETREILEQTAERMLAGNTSGTGTPDPAANPALPPEDQWTSHFGWGRVNLGDAVQVANDGKIPPQAAFQSPTPDWYAPLTGSTLHVEGHAEARFATAGAYTWKIEWAVGQGAGSEIPPVTWNPAAAGVGTSGATVSADIDLTTVRAALATYTPTPDTGGPTLSTASPNPYKNEFTVRLVVDSTAAGIPTKGVDRRVFTSAEDNTLRSGYPKRMGTGGEAPIRYADLDGDNVEELIVPTEDGKVHAYEPNGSELNANWPVETQPQPSAQGHGSAPGFAALSGTPPLEPLRGPAVADLEGDGIPEVIETAGIHVYVWEPDGTMRPGFPVQNDPAFCNPANESQNPSRHPKCGFLSSPTVGHLQGQNQPLDIVVPSLDGHLYAFDGDGDALSGFPVQLLDTSIPAPDQMIAEAINEPAIADLNGDGKDDVVVPSNETYDPVSPGPSVCPGSGTASDALASAAGGSSRVYAINGENGNVLPGWPIRLNGAIQDTLPLIGPGQNPSIAKIGGQTTIVASTTGSASINEYTTGGVLQRCVQQGVYGGGSDATDRNGTINLFESASLGKLLPADPDPDIVKYGLTVTDAANLLLVGQNLPYNHLMGAYNAQTGAPLDAYPRITDDFQFLSSSNIARIDDTLPENQVIAGTGLGLLHAYDGVAGVDVPGSGFPKVTGGWLFAPAAISADQRIADITREGYLFEWDLPNAPQCQTEWPSFRHDPQQTGNYDKDGTLPGKPTNPMLPTSTTMSFVAPGDDLLCFTADHYEVATSDNPITESNFDSATSLSGAPAPAAPGTTENFPIPQGAHRHLAIRAVDEQGNVGRIATFDRGACVPGGGDDDCDTILNGVDNCINDFNPNQENNDLDAQGDFCDPDDDNDTVLDAADNCVFAANPDQLDYDGDGIGNICDPTPGSPAAGGGSGGGTGGGAGGGSTSPKALKVNVKPKKGRVGRRSCFTITVTDTTRQPVPASTVTLGKKSKTTDASGRTRICRRFKKTGRPPVTAQKTGYTGATATVRVRRPRPKP